MNIHYLHWFTIFLQGILFVSAIEWSVQNLHPVQINDWIPLPADTERSLRYAPFPNHVEQSSVIQHSPVDQLRKYSFGKQINDAETANTQIFQNPPLRGHAHYQSNQNEDVQLLYVPLESLNQQSASNFNGFAQNVNSALVNDFYRDSPFSGNNKLRSVAPSTTTAPVTNSAEKLKPYQPPLSIFHLTENKPTTLNDVLEELQTASTIDVIDSPTNRRPKVFIGPHDMSSPQGYSKFELPYLSNIDWGRTERKIESLPFFVAPLSYKTPPGFAKIPLPAPHVGSVVVNTPFKQEAPKVAPSSVKPPALPPNRFNFEHFNTVKNEPTGTTRSPIRNSNSGFTSTQSLFKSPDLPSPPQNFDQGKPNYFQVSPETPSSTVAPTTAFRQTSKIQNFQFPEIQSPSTSRIPQTFFSSFGGDESFGGLVHNFKFVDSVKPSQNNQLNAPQPLPQRPQSVFSSSTLGIQQPSSTPSTSDVFSSQGGRRFPSSTLKPVSESTYETSTRANLYTPTAFLNSDGQRVSINGQSPVTIHSQNLLEVSTPQVINQQDLSPTLRPFINGKQSPSNEFVSSTTAGGYSTDGSQEASTAQGLNNNNFYRETTTKPAEVHTPTRAIPQRGRKAPQYKYENKVVAEEQLDKENYRQPSSLNTNPSKQFSKSRFSELRSRVPVDSKPYKSSDEYISSTEITTQQPRISINNDFTQTSKLNEEPVEVPQNTVSEVPKINPMLPGLINSLTDDRWMQTSKKENDEDIPSTRIPPRGRRPNPTYATQVSDERPRTRKPVTRAPLSDTTSSNTARPTGRSNLRNPGRVRYNPTPEERQRLKFRGRVQSENVQKDQEKDLEYQRDVLKQNYPVISPKPRLSNSIPTTTPKEVENNDDQNLKLGEVNENSSIKSIEDNVEIQNNGNYLNNEQPSTLEPKQINQEPTIIRNTPLPEYHQQRTTTTTTEAVQTEITPTNFYKSRTSENVSTSTIFSRKRQRTTKQPTSTVENEDNATEIRPRDRFVAREQIASDKPLFKSRRTQVQTEQPVNQIRRRQKLPKKEETTTDESQEQEINNQETKQNRNDNTDTSKLFRRRPNVAERTTVERTTVETPRNSTKRRGYWKKVRVQPVDTFEAAESQHIANNFLNTLLPEPESLIHDVKSVNSVQKEIVDKFILNETDEKGSVRKVLRKKVIKRPVQVVSWNREEIPKIIKTQLEVDDGVNNKSSEEESELVTVEPEITTILPVVTDESSMFDEVKKSLVELFNMDDKEEINGGVQTSTLPFDEITELYSESTTTSAPYVTTFKTTTTTESVNSSDNAMGSMILATSTSKHISSETEICYRGRCIKTERDLKN